MPKSRLRRVSLVALAALPLVGTGFVVGRHFPADGYQLYRSVFQLVSQEAVDSLPPDSLYQMSARGLIAVLDDPYSELFNRHDFENFNRNALGNRYGGVGLRIVNIRDTVQVFRVVPGGPAEAAGVQRGDRIITVGDSSAIGWTTDRVANHLTGEPGTPVTVGLLHHLSGQQYSVTVNRAVISVSVVPFTTLLAGNIGYVPIQRFSDRAAADVAAAVHQLEAQGATSFILDLRGNPGGSLDQAVAMGDLFVGPGRAIVTVKARHAVDTLRGTSAAMLPPRTPLAVLVDSSSASASEIVAGALQDYDRALLVGTNTYGKGVVQGAYTLPDGWVLKLTTARWYTPLGRPLQRTRADSARAVRPTYTTFGGRQILGGGGVVPDVIVFSDTLSSTALSLLRILNTRASLVNDVLERYAGELESQAGPGFQVLPAWRNELLHRFRTAGLLLPDSLDAGAAFYLDRLLEARVGDLVLSDSQTFARRMPRDQQLARAMALLQGTRSQAELLAAATRAKQGGL